MSPKTASDALVWVTSNDAKLPRNGEVRRQIRKQAMSAIAAERRHRGVQTRVNVGQVPIDILAKTSSQISHHSPAPSERTDQSLSSWDPGCSPPMSVEQSTCLGEFTVGKEHPGQRGSRSPSSTAPFYAQEVPRGMPASGYDLMRVTYNFDPLYLSSLTSFPVGQAAIAELHEQPQKLASVLRCRQWSYFTYIPGMYGHSECLDTALRCVVARTQQHLTWSYNWSEPHVNHLYSLAIRALQNVLDDPVQRLSVEALAACAILAIHELLLPPKSDTWKRHIAGASALIKLRGPSQFNTPFEKALLLAFVGPVYTEAMLNAEGCFLEDQPWKTALSSSVLEYTSYSECSEIYVSLWLRAIDLPRLLLDVQRVVHSPYLSTEHDIQLLQNRATMLKSNFAAWRGSYNSLVQATSTRPPEEQVHIKFDRRYEALGIYLASTAIVNRILISLDMTRYPQLDQETEKLAEQIIVIERQSKDLNPRAYLYMAFKMTVAMACLVTSEEWRNTYQAVDQCRRNYNLVPWYVFKRWIGIKGRKSDLPGDQH